MEKMSADGGADGKTKLDEWLAKRSKRLQTTSGGDASGRQHDVISASAALPTYLLPDVLKSVPGLPPSLIPPSQDDIISAGIKPWG